MGILTVDVGTKHTVASVRRHPNATGGVGSNEGGVVLVQNDMSKLETPTGVAFRGNRIEVGEMAALQPASNAANTVTQFVGYTGLDHEDLASYPIQPIFNTDSGASSNTVSALVEFNGAPTSVPLEAVLAWQLKAMAGYAAEQLLSREERETFRDGSHVPLSAWILAVTVPTAFTRRQIAALKDACAIAGFSAPLLIPEPLAAAQTYSDRHRTDIREAAAGVEGGINVVIVDVGHAASKAVLVNFDGSNAEVKGVEKLVGVGAVSLDNAMVAHFTQQLDAKHGEGTCAAPKAKFRLRNACERLKKMLSTIDNSQVGVDGLIPDVDVTLSLTRDALEAMTEEVFSGVRELVSRLLASSKVNPSQVHAVELLGGATRVPAIAHAIHEGAGGKAVSRTLDSSSGLCVGASLAAALRMGWADAAVFGCMVRGCELEEEGAAGMSEQDLSKCKAQFEDMVASQESLRLTEQAQNEVEGFLGEMRGCWGRKHGEKMNKAETQSLVEEAEKWLEEEEERTAEQHLHFLASLKQRFNAANAEFFAAIAEEEAAKMKQMAADAEERKREEAATRGDEDHDTRKLKFADRFRMAENNKKEGNELFKDGNILHAADRYAKALTHAAKMPPDLSPDQKAALAQLKGTVHLNLAQCFFKLGKFNKCIDNCSDSLANNPDVPATIVRRGLAYEKLKDFDKGKADAAAALALNPEHPQAAALLTRCEQMLLRRLENEKNMCQKMFG